MKAKRRWLYFVLILLNIPLGLATRWAPQYFPSLIRIYGGDVFSATCIFFGFRFLYPLKSLPKVSLISFLVCIAIEVQQLYQAEWAVKLRNTPLGILLGHGFLWSDCVCYAVGTVIAAALAFLLERLLHWDI
ncbi:DUF2809 domain-containing protein [Chitinophaga qingshengii]|uniref:DUF2809 domain-containing protein n=1 Tax=Chitinophaga qingshengii TaxID=1569794 RepID=A0ABR7TUZ8_9BACT|nr:DUF2809 domain-containing protein [Chitinophaga qingshengii]MBC9933251.1 DUF2809 domain-containing protein [Chitinophaga qingshengii]